MLVIPCLDRLHPAIAKYSSVEFRLDLIMTSDSNKENELSKYIVSFSSIL